MKVRRNLTVSIAAAAWFSCHAGAVGAAELRAGVAVVEITPPPGYRMSGYFKERISTAVHDPLQAKALVLAQGDTRVALVVCDLIGVPVQVSTRARAAIVDQTDIPAEGVIVAGTHTHTGPLYFGAMRDRLHEAAIAEHGRDPCEPTDYAGFLVERIARAVSQARSELKPVRIRAGTVEQDPPLSFNRRYHMADGTVRMNPGRARPEVLRPAGPIDPQVGMMLLGEPGNDKFMAGLTVFALHLDTTGGTQYSADYPFYLERDLRKRFGDSFVSIFGTGTCGDINHIDVHAAQRRRAEQIGSLLARTVGSAAADLQPVDSPELAIRRTIVPVGLQSYPPERVEQARSQLALIGKGKLPFLEEVEAYKIVDLQQRKGPALKLEVQAVRVSRNLALVALPGEVFVELGLAIKQKSPFGTTWVIELANDNPAYIPTTKAFKEGSYETVNSRIQPGGGEALVDAAVELLETLARND